MSSIRSADLSRRHWLFSTPLRTALASAGLCGGASGGAITGFHNASPEAATNGGIRLQAGELTAVIGDNSGTDTQRPGYNGVWSLQHAAADRSLFVPGISGLNLEHIVNGTTLDDDAVFFEPRRAAMTVKQTSDQSCELHQPPTPHTGLESRTQFELRPGGILDFHFECWPRQNRFPHGYLSMFWASYINAPEDRSMYFRGGPAGQADGWSQLCTQFHNDQSTVLHRDDQYTALFDADKRTALFRNFSPQRMSQPLFYGHFDQLTWLVIFDRTEGIRLTHSPSGGGFNSARQSHNPAWDFQFLIRNPVVNQRYAFSVRTMLLPRTSRDTLLQLAAAWQADRKR